MNRETFFETIHPLVDPSELITISHAYWLAKQVHREQMRDNGERYFEHCRRIAVELAHLRSATAQDITLAFLHDCIEDGFMPPGLLRALFGDEMARAVATISKTTPVFDDHSLTVVSRRKKDITDYFSGIAAGPAFVRRVKCADRLDNLRTMRVWTDEEQYEYIAETRLYVLPLAHDIDVQLACEIDEECRKYTGDIR